MVFLLIGVNQDTIMEGFLSRKTLLIVFGLCFCGFLHAFDGVYRVGDFLYEHEGEAYYILAMKGYFGLDDSTFYFGSQGERERLYVSQIVVPSTCRDVFEGGIDCGKYEKIENTFIPDFSSLSPAIVSDRSDPKIVHLDGLNFSRAWCLYGISRSMNDSEKTALMQMGNEHFRASFPFLSSGNYEGEHWLTSFAILSLSSRP